MLIVETLCKGVKFFLTKEVRVAIEVTQHIWTISIYICVHRNIIAAVSLRGLAVAPAGRHFCFLLSMIISSFLQKCNEFPRLDFLKTILSGNPLTVTF